MRVRPTGHGWDCKIRPGLSSSASINVHLYTASPCLFFLYRINWINLLRCFSNLLPLPFLPLLFPLTVTTSKSHLQALTRACGIILGLLYLAMVEHRQVGLHQPRVPQADSNQADSVFSGISTFGRLPYWPCLASNDEKYDIAFIGTFLLCTKRSEQV